MPGLQRLGLMAPTPPGIQPRILLQLRVLTYGRPPWLKPGLTLGTGGSSLEPMPDLVGHSQTLQALNAALQPLAQPPVGSHRPRIIHADLQQVCSVLRLTPNVRGAVRHGRPPLGCGISTAVQRLAPGVKLLRRPCNWKDAKSQFSLPQ